MVHRLLFRCIVALAAGFFAAVTPAMACTVTTPVTTTLGSYSSGAVKAALVPALQSQAGLACSSAVLTLLSGNYINAKLHSQNGMVLLRSGGSGSIPYTVSADPAGTYPFAQDSTINYMQNNLLNLLGLLGSSQANLPIYVKPTGGALPPVGSYSDTIKITWNWYLCPGIGALSLCIGTPDSGSAPTTITVTLNVTSVAMTMTLTSVTTWDALNGTTAPKALPGSRRRAIVSATNPDIAPLEPGAIAILMPMGAGETLALDGDGAGGTISLTDGSPASTLTLNYASPDSTTDDVDFSNDNGTTWTYVPVAGDLASEAAVTTIRLRPRGAMAAGSSFSIGVPFSVN